MRNTSAFKKMVVIRSNKNDNLKSTVYRFFELSKNCINNIEGKEQTLQPKACLVVTGLCGLKFYRYRNLQISLQKSLSKVYMYGNYYRNVMKLMFGCTV